MAKCGFSETFAMQELLPGVWTWAWFSEPHGYHFRGYFFPLPEGNLCVDPVPPDERTLAELVERGVSKILLTNRNHTRAANAVRGATGARTLVHPADAEHARSMGCVVDGSLLAPGRVGPFEVVPVPGKSPGEVALYWSERKLLLVGDCVVGHPPGSLSLLPERVMDDPARLRESVRSLLELDFDVLLVGDGEPVLGGAARKLRDLVASW
ncbi:MAG: hypothetical protein KatS3mg076_1431 [Candidatus Binatia bacterium]|nr:MAG: hypothetical protein KatS3mg076_1431 [Candidatus Binatia bacterium]